MCGANPHTIPLRFVVFTRPLRAELGDTQNPGFAKDLRTDDGYAPARGQRIHANTAAPALVPKTYYGMPAYARAGKDGKVIAFYKPKSKFKVRYSTFGFQPDAALDDGKMWATEFAVIELTPGVQDQIAELIKKAAG